MYGYVLLESFGPVPRWRCPGSTPCSVIEDIGSTPKPSEVGILLRGDLLVPEAGSVWWLGLGVFGSGWEAQIRSPRDWSLITWSPTAAPVCPVMTHGSARKTFGGGL